MSISKMLCAKAILFMIGIALFGLCFFFFVPHTFAQVSQGLETTADASGLAQADLAEIIGNIIRVILGFLGVIFLILVLYSGYLWMTAGGEEDKVIRAKKILINATIGLIIMLSAYAITTFVINALTGATSSSGSSSGGSSGSVSYERLSGSLGAGGIQMHYPARNATEVARNANIYVTFKEAMDIESFIEGYDVNGTPEDTSDDTVSTRLNTDYIVIYASADGTSEAFEASEVSVSFTEDLKTFVFNPVSLLGSSSENVSYTVYLDDDIKNADGDSVLNTGGYEWSFQVGTSVDLDPPTVTSVTPSSGSYDRNIAIEMTFSEAIDPTSASGIRGSDSGFNNIQVVGNSGALTAGEFVISNNYRTITFTSAEACGTNSCGNTIYCLPGNETITVTALAPTIGSEPPQANAYPYDGVTDTAGNGLDGDGDGTAGDDYSWSFTTTNTINLTPPEITSITPNILEEDVNLDEDVLVTFDSVMLSSTLTSSTDETEYISITPYPTHEMWYSVGVNALDSAGVDVSDSGRDAAVSQAIVKHGVFFESVDGGTTYYYVVGIGSGVKNQYQNCYVPGEGPNASGGACGTTSANPYCCNGSPSDVECSF